MVQNCCLPISNSIRHSWPTFTFDNIVQCTHEPSQKVHNLCEYYTQYSGTGKYSVFPLTQFRIADDVKRHPSRMTVFLILCKIIKKKFISHFIAIYIYLYSILML